jgi:hypothetical protein
MKIFREGVKQYIAEKQTVVFRKITNVPKNGTINGTFEKQQIERNLATKIKSFGRFPPESNVTSKTKRSAVGRILVRNINVDFIAASIQCI